MFSRKKKSKNRIGTIFSGDKNEEEKGREGRNIETQSPCPVTMFLVMRQASCTDYAIYVLFFLFSVDEACSISTPHISTQATNQSTNNHTTPPSPPYGAASQYSPE